MTEISRNYIGGDWVEGPHVSEGINPSNTDDVVGPFVHADAAQAQTAIAAAQDAFPAWSRSGIQTRHDILKRVGDELLARKDEIGRILARGRQDTGRRRRRDRARRSDLSVLLGRMSALGGEQAPLDTAGR